MNRLYYGDNLEVLRTHVKDETVDLVYLDPPFNSNATYNVLFKSASGAGADASIEAFDDTWSWGPAASEALMDIARSGNHKLDMLLRAMRTALGDNALMAYLAMMAVRLVELHRVLKPTGSLYLHCDPTASHYLKLVLDAVFGAENFRNEIIWRRTNAHNKISKQYGPIHDSILFVTKTDDFVFHPGRRPYTQSYIEGSFSFEDADGRYQSNVLTGAGVRTGDSGKPWRGYDPTPKGRHWAIPKKLVAALSNGGNFESLSDILDALDQKGLILHPKAAGALPRYKQYLASTEGLQYQDIWAYQPGTRGSLVGSEQGIDEDVKWLDSETEKLGYPTQKPLGLLARIIESSSNENDLVLDPFCGCGTAVDAAQKLGRRWIGIDITHLAIGMIEKRLRDGYGEAVVFETIGVPKDWASAKKLAQDDPHQFQAWACWQVGGYPWMGGRKGADKGRDGHFNYLASRDTVETGVISVKAGDNINPAMVRELAGTMGSNGHRLGLLLTAKLPTRAMDEEAASHGMIETEFGRHPAVQIFTMAELFQGKRPNLPPLLSQTKKAARVETRQSHKAGAQGGLEL
jgi:site-specific DNA-methyltransferase (adenine-specific)